MSLIKLKVCNSFLNSPKRNELLIEIVTNNVDDVAKRSPLLDLLGSLS